MRSGVLSVVCTAALLACAANINAQQVVVPAGTLIRCTLDEPDFSSATVDIGDPVICQLGGLREFGHSVFPRGSYLAGHLEAAKDPGHFVGKGYLKLQFDRIGLPNADIPVPAKVVAARGFRVDRQGDIAGKGHAKRDVAEWMFPPLWPWKVLTLPARGPRPTLKGEEPITLRLMDDVSLPYDSASVSAPLGSGWHYFGDPSSQSAPDPVNQSGHDAGALNSQPARVSLADATAASSGQNDNQTPEIPPTWFALKSNAIYEVASYRIDGHRLHYALANGTTGALDLTQVDWRRTSELNAQRSNAVAQSKPSDPPAADDWVVASAH